MAIYQYLNDIALDQRFYFLIVMIVALFFTTRVVPMNVAQVAGLAIGGLVVYFLQDRNLTTASNFNREYEVKLAKIVPVPKFFHTDANVVDLFANIADFKEYNADSWIRMIRAVDNLLQLHQDVKQGVSECKENMDVARGFMNDALNHLHSYIFSMPSNVVLNNKLEQNLDRLQLILRRHIDEMSKICGDQYMRQGINSHQHPWDNYGPRGVDPMIQDSHFDLYY